MHLIPDIVFQKQLIRWSKYLMIIVFLIAVFVLLGWQLNIKGFQHPTQKFVSMNPVTAVAFICTAISFLILTLKKKSASLKITANVLASVVALIGAVKIFSLITNIDLHVDQFLFTSKLDAEIPGPPSRIAPNTAGCLIFTGISLFLLNFDSTHDKKLAHYVALIIALFGLLSILGYVYQVYSLYGVRRYTPMAWQAATCFILIALSILFAHPDTGVMRQFTSTLSGSQTARILIPTTILTPVLLGLLRLYGYKEGLFTHELGVVIFVLAIIAVFLIITWYTTVLLNNRDKLKQETEEQLRESERQVQTIFDAAPDAIIVINEAGNVIKWNPMAENLFGWTEQEVIGKSLNQSIIPARYRHAHSHGLQHYLQTGHGPILDKTIEIQALTKNNTEIDISLRISPTKIKDNRLFISFLRDITVQKKTAAENNYLANLVNQTSEAIFSTDMQLTILSWNNAAEQMYGYSKEEAIGKNLSALLKSCLTDNNRAEIVKSLHKKEYFQDELEYTHKNGQTILVLTSNTLMRKDGEVTGYVTVHKDITERRNAEAQIKHLANLVNQSGDAIISTDTNYIIKTWNGGAQTLYGYTAEEVIGKDGSTIVNPDSPEEEKLAIRRQLQEKGYWVGELKLKNKKKEVIFSHVSLNLTRNNEGIVNGVVVVSRDITQRKNLEEQLRQLNEQLEEKVKAKTAEIHNVFERVSDAVVALDVNWHFTYINSRATQILNRSAESLIGKHIWTEMPEGIGQPFYEAYYEAMAKQEYRYLEEYYPPYNLWFENHIYPSPTGLSIYFRDITFKKHAEIELKKNEEQYRQIVETAQEGIWMIDENNITTLVNAHMAEMLGYEKEEMIGKSLFDFMDEEGKKIAQLNIERRQRGIEERHDFRFRSKEGKKIWTLLATNPIFQDGKYKGALAMVMDITERKKADAATLKEKDFSDSIIKSLPGIFYLFDIDGKYLRWNKNFETVSGYSSTEIMNMTPGDFFEGEEKIYIGGRIEKVFTEGQSDAEAGLLSKSGTKIPHYFTGIAVDFEGKPCVLGVGHDTTERQKAVIALKQSEEKYRSFFLNSLDGILLTSPDGKIFAANPAACKIFDMTEEELCQAGRQGIVDNEDPQLDKILAERQQKGQAKGELMHYRKGGAKFPAEISTATFIDATGQRRTNTIIRDITERKKAQEAIITEKNLSDIIINNLPGIFYLYNEEGTFLRWNKNLETVTGYSGDEIKNMKPLDFFTGEQQKIVEKRIAKVFKGKQPGIEALLHTKDKREIPFYFNSMFLNYEGKPSLIGMAIDISERKEAEEQLRQSEQKYRLLFEDNPMPLWMFSLGDLRFIDVNEAAVRHYGYSKEEFLTMRITDIRPAEDNEKLLTQTLKADKGVRHSGTWRHIKKDGTIINVDIVSHDTLFKGQPVRLVLSIDVTEKLKAEDLLKKSYVDIRELASHLQDVREEERARIAREIHDELGQQLTGLKMDVSWLNRKSNLDEEQMKLKIKNILQLLDGAINTVRKISAELRPSLLDDLGLIEALEWYSTEFYKRSGIKVLFQSQVSEITVDPRIGIGLFRIYQESLTNVARHAEATKVTGTLQFKNNTLILSITDDGKGFDVSSIGPKKTLGMLGMKERTLMMGGEYVVTSQPGKGTTVLVTVSI